MTPLESAKDALWEAIAEFDPRDPFSRRQRKISVIEAAIEMVVARAQEAVPGP
jgi:hypothetical protein